MPTFTDPEWNAIKREYEGFKSRAISIPTFVIWFMFWIVCFISACMLIHASYDGPTLNKTTYSVFGSLILVGTLLTAAMSMFYFYKTGWRRNRLPKEQKKSQIEMAELNASARNPKAPTPTLLGTPASSLYATNLLYGTSAHLPQYQYFPSLT